jgi:hypothetical protein
MRRLHPTLAALLMLGAFARPASAQTVCNVIDSLSPFGIAATKIFKAKLAPPFYGGACRLGMTWNSSICANQMVLFGASVYPSFNSPIDYAYLVSPKTTGKAIVFKHPAAQYPCYTNSVDWAVTGGGDVLSLGSEEPDLYGIDTTGTHPLVSSCAGALVDMGALSDAIAAMPATQTIEKVVVRRNETAQIDARGGGIVRIGTLALQGGRGAVRYGYNYQCLYTYGFYQAAQLEIITDYDDEVILDVGSLKLGNCTFLELYTDKFLVNIASTGRKARVGVDVEGNGYPINILAPHRTVQVDGERHGELGTFVGDIWADKVIVRGGTYQEDPTECP